MKSAPPTSCGPARHRPPIRSWLAPGKSLAMPLIVVPWLGGASATKVVRLGRATEVLEVVAHDAALGVTYNVYFGRVGGRHGLVDVLAEFLRGVLRVVGVADAGDDRLAVGGREDAVALAGEHRREREEVAGTGAEQAVRGHDRPGCAAEGLYDQSLTPPLAACAGAAVSPIGRSPAERRRCSPGSGQRADFRGFGIGVRPAAHGRSTGRGH
jgi:hypothetical protein